MTYNIYENIQYCKDFVDPILGLINYSHALPAAVALLVSLFVFYHQGRLLLSKILLALTASFTIWTFLNFLIWTNYSRGDIIMFAWAPLETLSTLMFLLSFYFIYVFIEKKDLSTTWKVFGLILLSPIIIFATTTYNLENYDIQECIASENSFYIYYVRIFKIALASLLGVFVLFKLFTKKENRAQIALLSLGVAVFVYTFLISSYISEKTLDFRYEFYGLFGMIVFVGILSYLIVKYQALAIKLIAAQALVMTLILLTGAQFFFIRNPLGLILSGFTLSAALGFGYLLVKSVKIEVEQREKIEILATELKSANDRLRELDKQKSEFLSFASHQLRSPLTAIKGYASLILDGTFGAMSDSIKDAVDKIFQSSQGMVLMVEDFLNISRIEQGRMKYEMTDLDIGKLAEEITGEMKPVAEKKGLSLSYVSDSGSHLASADPGKLRQVIANLVDNSIKYTPSGSVVVSTNKVGSNIRITVTDTGVGISGAEINNLFEKFKRTKSANEVNVMGTGLGLYLAKMIVIAHKGKVWAESDGEGNGSRFIIELPAK